MRIELINDAAVQIFGIPREVATGQMLTTLWNMEKDDPGFGLAKQVLSSQEPFHYEWHTDNLGARRWFDVTLRPFGDAGLAALYRETTEKKRQMIRLEEQHAFYEELIRQSPLRKTVLRPMRNEAGEIEDFFCDYANFGAEIDDSHRNLPPFAEAPLGKTVLELLPQVKQTPIWNFYCQLAESGIAAATELHYDADQTDTIAEVSGKRLADGRILVSFADVSQSRRTARELDTERARLTAVLEHIQLGVTVFEAVRDTAGELKDLRLVRRNEMALRLSRIPAEGYQPGALLSELMPPELSENVQTMLDVVRTGQPLVHELYQPHLKKWISSHVVKHGDGLLSTIQDITEHRSTSQKIEEGARLLNAVLDSSPMAVVVYKAVRDTDNVIGDFQPIIANRLALEISGFELEHFLNLSFFQRNPHQRVELLPQLSAIIEKRETRQIEHLVPGTARWVRSITMPFGDGFIATSQDITDHKKQSALIEEQAELFNGVLRSLQNGLSIFRIIRNESGGLEDLEYLEIAESVEHDTGKSREEIIGQRIRTLFPGIETTDYWTAYQKVAVTGEAASFETHFTLPGYDNYLLNWVTAIGEDKLVSVYYLINDLKQAQRELEHTVQELKRSNEDLEQFASIASHDLQEPLRKVQSFGAMLESRYAETLGEDGKDLLQRMQSAAGRMRNLVTGLLAFARLSGDEDVPLAPVDPNMLLADIINDLDQTAASKDGRVNIPERLPFVLGIEGQLRHLFHNLLTNSLKFHKEDVAPVVSITQRPLDPEDIAGLSPLVNPADYVRIEVTDNGIGFEPEYAEKIFGLFERLHGMNKYQGTGLGLSICRRVADRHEGTIRAVSAAGEGATFIVLLRKA